MVIHQYLTVFIWQFFGPLIFLAVILSNILSQDYVTVNCEPTRIIHMLACVAWRFWLGALNNKGGRGQSKLKQRLFWVTHVDRKWTFCILEKCFSAKSSLKSEDTRQYKFGNVEAYLKGNGFTSGWRASLKNVLTLWNFTAEINTSFADHNNWSRKTLEWYFNF